jgi:hypothetical protein
MHSLTLNIYLKVVQLKVLEKGIFRQVAPWEPSPSRMPRAKVGLDAGGPAKRLGFHKCIHLPPFTEFQSPFYRAMLAIATLYNSTPCRSWYIPRIFLCWYKPPGAIRVSSSSIALAYWATSDGPSSAHSPTSPSSWGSLGCRGLRQGAFAGAFAAADRSGPRPPPAPQEPSPSAAFLVTFAASPGPPPPLRSGSSAVAFRPLPWFEGRVSRPSLRLVKREEAPVSFFPARGS